MKNQILQAIGESRLRRPAELSAALAANNRLKYYFSLLQMAGQHAEYPDQFVDSLRRERLAAGVDDASLDEIASASRRQDGRYSIQGCAKLLERITQDLRVTATPLLTNGVFAHRLERLLAALPVPQDECIAARAVSEITRAGRKKSDSVHQLVMDLHKALLAMQSELAEERIDGASVYHIDPGDRVLIRGFMAGLNRTSPLKFNHPGLATTAAREGNKLAIQNDIGETDAHVIVIHVEGMTVNITCSDVHLERLQFMRNMLSPERAFGSYGGHWTVGCPAPMPTLAAPPFLSKMDYEPIYAECREFTQIVWPSDGFLHRP
jgi:hypothetical protein